MWCINVMYKVKYNRSIVIILSCNVPSVDLPQGGFRGEEQALVFKLAKTCIFLLSTQDQLKANVARYMPLCRFTSFARIVSFLMCKSFNTVSGRGRFGQPLDQLLYNFLLNIFVISLFLVTPKHSRGRAQTFFQGLRNAAIVPRRYENII